MEMIGFEDGAVDVDANIIAEGLGIDPSTVHDCLRQGKITARHERGIAEDEGLHRLSFFAGRWRFQIVVDETGNVIRRSTAKVFNCAPFAPARKPNE
jgi:hypothetical protein